MFGCHLGDSDRIGRGAGDIRVGFFVNAAGNDGDVHFADIFYIFHWPGDYAVGVEVLKPEFVFWGFVGKIWKRFEVEFPWAALCGICSYSGKKPSVGFAGGFNIEYYFWYGHFLSFCYVQIVIVRKLVVFYRKMAFNASGKWIRMRLSVIFWY